jgi:hypothetical protein
MKMKFLRLLFLPFRILIWIWYFSALKAAHFFVFIIDDEYDKQNAKDFFTIPFTILPK